MKINRRAALKSLILAAGGLSFIDLKDQFNVGRPVAISPMLTQLCKVVDQARLKPMVLGIMGYSEDVRRVLVEQLVASNYLSGRFSAEHLLYFPHFSNAWVDAQRLLYELRCAEQSAVIELSGDRSEYPRFYTFDILIGCDRCADGTIFGTFTVNRFGSKPRGAYLVHPV